MKDKNTLSGIPLSAKEKIIKKETRFLRYDFTAVETHDMASELAVKIQRMDSKEKEKTAVVSQLKSAIDELKSSTNNLSQKITNGFEMRDIECEVKYHFPEQGKKQITRTDNKEESIEKMTTDEWNLFNQED